MVHHNPAYIPNKFCGTCMTSIQKVDCDHFNFRKILNCVSNHFCF